MQLRRPEVHGGRESKNEECSLLPLREIEDLKAKGRIRTSRQKISQTYSPEGKPGLLAEMFVLLITTVCSIRGLHGFIFSINNIRRTPQKRKSFNPNYYFRRASATTYYPLDKSGLVVL